MKVEPVAWPEQLIKKDTAHQLAFAVKFEAEERLPHVAGSAEGLRLEGTIGACDEIMELIAKAKVATPPGYALVPDEATDEWITKMRVGTVEPQGMDAQAKIIQRLRDQYRKFITAAKGE